MSEQFPIKEPLYDDNDSKSFTTTKKPVLEVNNSIDQPLQPPDGGRGWLVVFGSFLVSCIHRPQRKSVHIHLPGIVYLYTQNPVNSRVYSLCKFCDFRNHFASMKPVPTTCDFLLALDTITPGVFS